MRRRLLVLLMVLTAASVQAQAPSGYVFKVFNQGASSPLQTTTLQASSFVCDQTPPPPVTGTAINPTKVSFNDPVNTGQACIYVDNGTGPLLALPFGTQIYTATIATVNSAGTSADSASSNPFTHPGTVAPVLTGLRVGL